MTVICSISGDLRERNIIFDISDFDETRPAPWEWDIKRLAASCVVAAQHNGLNNSDGRDIAKRCVQSYRERIREYARMSVLERRYRRKDADHILGAIRMKKWRREVEEQIAKATTRTVLENDFPKLATVKDGQPRIKDNPPLIFHETTRGAEEFGRAVKAAFREYRATLSDERRALLDHFEMKDVAWKVVGVGSVGTYCAIVLLMAGEDDVLFMQVKEARASVLETLCREESLQEPRSARRGRPAPHAGRQRHLSWVDRRRGAPLLRAPTS